MELILLNCNHCGNVLEAGINLKYVTCTICKSQLEIVRTSNSIFTKVYAADTNTPPIAAMPFVPTQNPVQSTPPVPPPPKPRKIDTSIQKLIDDLDQRWLEQVQEFNQNGVIKVPSSQIDHTPSIVWSGMGFMFGLAGLGNMMELTVCGAIMILVGIYFFIKNANQTMDLAEAQAKYDSRRQHLETMLYIN